MARYTGQGLIDSNYPNPSTEFGIQTEGSTYGRFDTQVTANTTYKRYNYQHSTANTVLLNGSSQYYTVSHTNNNNSFTYNIWAIWDGTYENSLSHLVDTRNGSSTGAGHLISIYNGNFYLGNNTTVFQAEVKALQKSADMLYNKGWTNQTITTLFLRQSS